MRDIPQAILDAVKAERATPATLFEAEFTDPSTGDISTVRIATTRQDVEVTLAGGRVETFLGGGEFVGWGGIKESVEDEGAANVRIQMSGVDRGIVNLLMSHHFRGHDVRLWLAFWNEETGQPVGEAYQLFEGFQLGSYEVTEDWGDEREPGSVTVQTQVKGYGTANRRTLVVTNPVSHNRFLQRVRQPVGDLFFGVIPSFAGREIFWGREAPDPATGSRTGGGGSSGGGGGGLDDPGGGGDPFRPFA